VKENQPALLAAIRALTATLDPTDTDEDRCITRSRQEDRTVEIFPAARAVAGTEWEPHIQTIIRVTRSTLVRSAKTGLWKERQEVAYYVTSATGRSAKFWADAIRGHWGIENRNHYVRDVTQAEDQSRIRQNPGIMARVRSFALNILRANGVKNVADATWRGAINLDKILAYNAI
jgi:predicted transposase YbfD/YdcC